MTDEELKSLPVGTKLRIKTYGEIQILMAQQRMDWVDDKAPYCGKEVTIAKHLDVSPYGTGYRVRIEEDNCSWRWYASMLDLIIPQIASDEFKKIMQ